MADFNIRSDSVNVEEIMRQIRARIRDKRGVDYTEQEIRDLAAVKLEKFLDPSKVRSDLLEQYRELQQRQMQAEAEVVDEMSLFGSPRPWLRRVRKWLRPVLKLFLNPVALMRASRVNVRHTDLLFEIVHNLVVETTRMSIDLKTLKMRVESVASRLDFDERRARALEGVVQFRAGATSQETPAAAPRKDDDEGEGEAPAARSKRRRRRRGRRGGGARTGPDVAAGSDTGGETDEEPAIAEGTTSGEPNTRHRTGGQRDADEPRREGTTAAASEHAEVVPERPVERSSREDAQPSQEQDPGRHEPGN